jgi:hypothetical protein
MFVKQGNVDRRTLWRDFLRVEKVAGNRLGWRITKALLAYLRPGFHPNQVGSLEGALSLMEAEGIGR